MGLIDKQLEYFARLEREGMTSALEYIRTQAHASIPGPLMQTLWQLLLSGRVKSPRRELALYRWKEHFERDGLTVTLRLGLRELLSPKVTLRKPFPWGKESKGTDEPTHLRQLVDWELVLSADHVQSALRDLVGEKWEAALPSLLEDFQQLLRDALDLMRGLGEADDRNDRSIWDLPSISPHRQNRGYHDWVMLIELLRDAWLAVRRIDADRATQIAHTWFEPQYPTFKRLALFTASQDGCIAPVKWVDWLLADGAWWLWSLDTRREVFRLLVLQGLQMAQPDQERLEAAILAGPQPEMYRDDLEPERRQELVERSVWLRLAKLNTSGLALGEAATACLNDLSHAHPTWTLAENESDEFSVWMTGTGDPDYEERRHSVIVPRRRSELVQWLQQPATPDRHHFYEEAWREYCRAQCFRSFCALHDLARDGVWLAERWGAALYAWSEEERVRRSWCHAAPLVYIKCPMLWCRR
jgi:hypothetical protein